MRPSGLYVNELVAIERPLSVHAANVANGSRTAGHLPLLSDCRKHIAVTQSEPPEKPAHEGGANIRDWCRRPHKLEVRKRPAAERAGAPPNLSFR